MHSKRSTVNTDCSIYIKKDLKKSDSRVGREIKKNRHTLENISLQK